MKKVYICQLDKKEKLAIYKYIKSVLIENDCLTYENIKNAMDNKIKDIY